MPLQVRRWPGAKGLNVQDHGIMQVDARTGGDEGEGKTRRHASSPEPPRLPRLAARLLPPAQKIDELGRNLARGLNVSLL